MLFRLLFIILTQFLDASYSAELLLVQVAWRHGDRAPMGTYKNNPYPESEWPVRYGELLLTGLKRHMDLGNLLKKEYIDTGFLPPTYSSDMIRVRSTDRNRTLLSAAANLIGMYSSGTAKAGKDYPDDQRWPVNYVPIPVHTIDPEEDKLLDPLAPCRRYDWLWNTAMNTSYFQNFTAQYQWLLENMTAFAGQRVTMDNLWYIYDAIYTRLFNQKNMTFDPNLFETLETVKKTVDDMEDGLYLPPDNGIDFRREIRKVRGGLLVNTMVNRMKHKWRCYNDPNQKECSWIRNFKYYAYSAHDNTVTAILAALGNKTAVVPLGYPHYAACVSLELWKMDNGSPGVQLKFHQDEDNIPNYRRQPGNNGFEVFTHIIEGCENIDNNDYCPLEAVAKTAELSNPGDIDKLCNEIPTKPNPSSIASESTTTKSGVARLSAQLLWLAFAVQLTS